MFRSLRLFFGLLSVASCVFAQHLSYGVAIGTALTDDVNAKDIAAQGLFQEGIRPASKSVIVGPVLQWNFTPRFAVEVDGLFRELHFNSLVAGSQNSNPTITWEFPVLAKYEFNAVRSGNTRLRPFLEAGPSFRTTGNLNTTPSHFGVSAGGGLEVRWRKISFTPTVRYTRWQHDPPFTSAPLRADQVKFFVALTDHPDRDALPYMGRLSIGAVLGVNFLSDYFSQSGVFNSLDPASNSSYSSTPGRRSFLVGPSVEVRIGRGWSAEGDAIYRPMRSRFVNTSVFNGQTIRSSGEQSVTTWQFPVMAKYKFSVPFLSSAFKPFVLAGPSFREGNDASHYGVTAGLGISVKVHHLQIAPSLRYTRWQAPYYSSIKPDELNLLVGFSV